MAGAFDHYDECTSSIPLRCLPIPNTLMNHGRPALTAETIGEEIAPALAVPTEDLPTDDGTKEDLSKQSLSMEDLRTRDVPTEDSPMNDLLPNDTSAVVDGRSAEDKSAGEKQAEDKHGTADMCKITPVLAENSTAERSSDPMVEVITESFERLRRPSDPPMVEIINEPNEYDPNQPDSQRQIVEIIPRPSVNRSRRATESIHIPQPILRLDTSVMPVLGPFTSPTYESPSQRRRRERRTSCMNQVVPATDIVAGSTVSIDVVHSPIAPTPRGKRNRRRISPNRRRDGEIDILDESEDDGEVTMDFRGRQKKRPSELRCFTSNSFGPKRAYPAQTPLEPGVAPGLDFRRMPLEPALRKRVSDWVGENARVVEFVSTPISPVPEVWSP